MEPEEFERRVGASVRALMASRSFERPWSDVVARATSPTRARARNWPRASRVLLPVAAVILLGVVTVGVFVVGRPPSSGSMPSHVYVNEVFYRLSAPYELPIGRDLEAHGVMVSPYLDTWFADRTAYRLPGIDPLSVLVGKAVPSGTYRFLWGPKEDEAFPAICPYFVLEPVPVPDRCRT